MNARDLNSTPPVKTLVIGYGNELRGDDGVGRKLAEEVDSWQFDGVETLSTRQLTPDLAEALRGCSSVIFIDATIATDSGPEVRVMPLSPTSANSVRHSHHSGPAEILALAEMLHGKAPTAVLLTIPGESFRLSEKLSKRAEHNFSLAVSALKMLLEAFRHNAGTQAS